jgi:RNA recognition motif-containing protein
LGKKLYVGNLPFKATDAELESLFAQAGTVTSAKIITDMYSGQSKGFGFVEMATDEEAAAAVEKLNGTNFLNRALTVNEARPQTKREGGGGRPGGGGGRPGGGGGDRGGWR